MSRSTEQVATRVAAEMLGEPRNYALVHYLVRTGKLTSFKASPRKWFFNAKAVEPCARERDQYGKAA